METKKRERKSVATIKRAFKKGDGPQQKMVSFRCDNDVLEKLQQEANKGRLINELLRKHFGV